MSDKPKRRWIQIHLSTSIVLMFSGSGIMGLNALPHNATPKDIQEIIRNARMEYVYRESATSTYGWPVRFIITDSHAFCGSEHAHLVNLAVGVALLILIGVATEFVIRRNEARKP